MMPTLTTSMEKIAAAIGCAKQCGETGTHAAHDHNMLVLVVKK